MSTHYDVLIVGAGVTGTALLYELAKFTDLGRLCLVEAQDSIATLNSHAHNNSQTIHCGDIETHYSLNKASAVRRTAYMVLNYATKLPTRERDRIVHKMPKMVLGVGPTEGAALRQRYEAFKGLYPRMRLLERQDIADIEPNVALVDGTWRRDEIVATGTPDDYSAVDFKELAQSFSHECVRMDRTTSKQITQLFSTKVEAIRQDGKNYVVDTSRGPLQARAVVVCAGGHSLSMAQSMGLGLEYVCLPVAGSFYFAPEALNGKVYRPQNLNLPFAAVHGDRDIKERGKTRFGPTALMLPMLDRQRRERFERFSDAFRFDRRVARAVWDLLRVKETRDYILRNFLYEIPRLSRHLIIKEIRRIVPSIDAADITHAEGFGGVRPQLIDTGTGRLKMGEIKIANGAGLIFNMTPSPGGTSCLGSGEQDMRTLAGYLGARIDEQAFERELLRGYEDTRHDRIEPMTPPVRQTPTRPASRSDYKPAETGTVLVPRPL